MAPCIPASAKAHELPIEDIDTLAGQMLQERNPISKYVRGVVLEFSMIASSDPVRAATLSPRH
ncbi:hypothetical protein AJ87_49250 [Rhizobium yanglingense]|nr:hypothetical protein AJ87_49250 [Rhizobium yanglingense]